jgi:hypothetical protein
MQTLCLSGESNTLVQHFRSSYPVVMGRQGDGAMAAVCTLPFSLSLLLTSNRLPGMCAKLSAT